MNSTRAILILLLLILVNACGVSPRVRVEPLGDSRAPANRTSTASPRTPSNATMHTVAKGDTLYSIAFRNGIDVRDLIAWNRIAAPYTIFPGQQLTLRGSTGAAGGPTQASAEHPSSTAPAMPVPTAPPPVPPPANAAPIASTGLGPRAVVDADQPARVETLAGAPPAAASSAVRLAPRPAPGQPGSLIAAINTPPVAASAATASASPGFKPVPTAAAPVVAAPATAAAATPSGAPPPAATPTPPAAIPKAPPAVPTTAPPVATAAGTATPVAARIDVSGPSQSREGIVWRWPTAGTVIGRFINGDPTQQGIDISGKLGQSVLSVADGEVVYSGNGLLGYGEMIIVQHSPDYLSAYGHNQRRLVAEGDKVKAGQVIAEMGQRGSQVILHFEVRRRGKPVDPLSYLPPR